MQYVVAVERSCSLPPAIACDVRVSCCDAQAMLQPLLHTPAFDCCLAVDSVYHFPCKARVLQDVCSCLSDGGAFACSDMLLQEVEFDA